VDELWTIITVGESGGRRAQQAARRQFWVAGAERSCGRQCVTRAAANRYLHAQQSKVDAGRARAVLVCRAGELEVYDRTDTISRTGDEASERALAGMGVMYDYPNARVVKATPGFLRACGVE